MDTVSLLRSQYLAALAMLGEAVKKCPAALWDDPQDHNPFWRVAFHALFYTHLYLQPTEQVFIPWEKHRADAEYFGRSLPESNAGQSVAYTQAEILEYLDFCCRQVVELLPTLDFDAPSGFHWLPFGKLELQIYSIRHIQHHTGELSERLAVRADGVELDWVGTSADLAQGL